MAEPSVPLEWVLGGALTGFLSFIVTVLKMQRSKDKDHIRDLKAANVEGIQREKTLVEISVRGQEAERQTAKHLEIIHARQETMIDLLKDNRSRR